MPRPKTKRMLIRLAEFFLVGLVMGILEDVIAIKLATDAVITWRTLMVAFWVALPFAVISEFIVDGPVFRQWVQRRLK